MNLNSEIGTQHVTVRRAFETKHIKPPPRVGLYAMMQSICLLSVCSYVRQSPLPHNGSPAA